MRCLVCAATYMVRAVVVRAGRGRYCSRACVNTAVFGGRRQNPGFVARRTAHLRGISPSHLARERSVAARRGVPPSPESEARRLASLRATINDPVRGKALRQRRSAISKAWHRGLTPERYAQVVRARRLHGKPSSLEQTVELWLKSINVAYVAQYPIPPYSIDFWISGTPLLVECDGEYYHSSPSARRHDEERDKFLRAAGYTVLRLNGADIKGGSARRVVEAAIASMQELAHG